MRTFHNAYGQQPFASADLVEVAPAIGRLVHVQRRDVAQDGVPAFRVTAVHLTGDTAWSRTSRYSPIDMPAHFRTR